MRILLWVVTALVALLFAGAGALKLAGSPDVVAEFAKWGYPDWFRHAVGAAEVVGAALLLVPRTARLAAGGLALIMLGAVATHLRTPGEAPEAIFPLVVLGLLAVIGWARWPGPRRRP